MSKIRWSSVGKTDTGKVRTNNEDSMLVDDSIGLFIVADGMGGHQSGEVASKMAVEVLHQNLKQLLTKSMKPEKYDSSLSLEGNQLAFCTRLANQAVFEASQYPQNKGMGTTLSAALIHGEKLSIAHVGDSRIYLFRQGRLDQITDDHSLVMDQVRKGILRKEDAEKSNLSNVLLRAVGTESEVQVDAHEHPLFDNDLLILCSDGLCKMVKDEEISAVIRAVNEPREVCDTLVEAALGAGGRDNVTVVAVRVSAGSMLSGIKSKIAQWGRQNHA